MYNPIVKLTSDQIKHVAKLANLSLTPNEEEKYSEQLSKILNYIDQLNTVDTKNTEATFNVTGLENVTRGDKTAPSLSSEEALANASQKENGFFVTKGIFQE